MTEITHIRKGPAANRRVELPDFSKPTNILIHAAFVECDALEGGMVLETVEAGVVDSEDEVLCVSYDRQTETLDLPFNEQAPSDCPLRLEQGERSIEDFARVCGRCAFAVIEH